VKLKRAAPPNEQHCAPQQSNRDRVALPQQLSSRQETPNQRIRQFRQSAEEPDTTHNHAIARQALRKAHEDLRQTTALVSHG
jgi:hypothetical protein